MGPTNRVMYSNVRHVCALEAARGTEDAPAAAGLLPWLGRRAHGWLLAGHWTRGVVRVQSRRALRLERARQLRAKHFLLVHPYSPFRFYWDCLFFIFTLAVFIYMPYQPFFHCPNVYDPFILLCDAIAFADIGINLVTGYSDEWLKVVVLDRRSIITQYAKHGLVWQLAGALPLQLIDFFPDCSHPTNTIFFLPKLLRFGSFVDKWKGIREQLDMSYVATSFVSVVGLMILFLHWATYIYYQVPCLACHYYGPEEEAYQRWFQRQLVTVETSSFQRYVTAMYSVCGLSIGAGYYRPLYEHLLEELLLSAALSVLGLLFLTYGFMTLLRLQMYRNYPNYLYNGRLNELEKYMAARGLPHLLRQKIKVFVQYKFGGDYFNEQSIRDTINEPLKQDISMHACGRLLDGVPLFTGMPVALLNSIIFSLVHKLYMPGEIIAQYNQPGESLFLISSGTVTVIGATGKELTHLKDGGYFGQQALLQPGSVRDATYVALEITELYKLSSKPFQACLQPYPNIRRKLEGNLTPQTDEFASTER